MGCWETAITRQSKKGSVPPGRHPSPRHFHPIGVLWGFRKRAELEVGGAKAIVEEPGKLMTLF